MHHSKFFTGPIDETIGDFWRMVWEYKVPSIVMLTNLVERNVVSDVAHVLLQLCTIFYACSSSVPATGLKMLSKSWTVVMV